MRSRPQERGCSTFRPTALISTRSGDAPIDWSIGASPQQVFAKLKDLLRTAAARTIPDLWAAIRQAFTRFTPQECRNDLAAAGYENDLVVAT